MHTDTFYNETPEEKCQRLFKGVRLFAEMLSDSCSDMTREAVTGTAARDFVGYCFLITGMAASEGLFERDLELTGKLIGKEFDKAWYDSFIASEDIRMQRLTFGIPESLAMAAECDRKGTNPKQQSLSSYGLWLYCEINGLLSKGFDRTENLIETARLKDSYLKGVQRRR